MDNLTPRSTKRKPLLSSHEVPAAERDRYMAIKLTLLDVDSLHAMGCHQEAKNLSQRLFNELHILLGGAW